MVEELVYENIDTVMDQIAVSSSLAYPMDKRRMGNAYIINNVAKSHPGSVADVKEMENACKTLGFDVSTDWDCTQEKMSQIKNKILREDTHMDSNCVLVAIISHGSSKGVLLDTDRQRGWGLEDFVSELSVVESLLGKPKIVIVQACRGTFESEGRSPTNKLADTEIPCDSVLVADKADMFIAFATVPLYVADAGGETGSHFMQSFARFLRNHHKELPLDRIFLMVKQYVARALNGKQCPEERSSLKYLLNFVMGPRPAQLLPTFRADTGLSYWARVRSARMPSTRDVVLWIRLSLSPTDPPMFHIYSGSARSWKRTRSIAALCEHENLKLLPTVVRGTEYLAVACIECKKIRLLDLLSGGATIALDCPEYFPGYLCSGEPGRLFVVHVKGDDIPILELDCSSPTFQVLRKIQTRMNTYYAICYIPGYNLLAVSDTDPGLVRGISCAQGHHKVWELSGEVDGKPCRPHGMVYSPVHKALLVADGNNCRILVLNPESGAVRQVIALRASMGTISELSLHNKQVVIRHTESAKVCVSFYALE